MLGPTSDQAQAMLRMMLRRHYLGPEHLAVALGVAREIVNAWLTGRRRITQPQRRLIWLVASLLDGTAPRNLFELSTWNRFRDWEAEEREADAGTKEPAP